jgi:hypothetical protein
MAPLRKVVANLPWMVPGVSVPLPSDLLECGHRLAEASDIYGPRYPARRRCHKCERGEPRDFDPSDVAVS